MPDRIRHLAAKGGRWYWTPSPTLRKLGMVSQALGTDYRQAVDRAVELNEHGRALRKHQKVKVLGPAPGTVGLLVKQYRLSEEYLGLAQNTRRTIDPWLDELDELLRDHPARLVGPLWLKNWRKKLRAERGEYQAFHAMGAMRVLFAWAVSEEWIKDSPAKQVKNPRPPKREVRWTLGERAAFVRAALAEGSRGMALALIVADWLAQSPIDIKKLQRRHYVNGSIVDEGRSKTGVGKHPMPLAPEIQQMLGIYLADRGAEPASTPLFLNDRVERPFTSPAWHKTFRRIRAAAGISPTLQFQDLRRTAATEAGELGGTPLELQTLLRHSSLTESSTYIKMTGALLESIQGKRRQIALELTQQEGLRDGSSDPKSRKSSEEKVGSHL